MANRYTRVFSQGKSLYTESSPVIILAGALLKDEQTGNIIAQLKFKSISEKIIKAIKVDIIPYDTSGGVCGEKIEFSYLDLTINRDDEFGSKEPILMPNPNTRAFKVQVKEAVFTDNTKWNKEEPNWTTMDFDQTSIAEVFSEPELAKQYQITFGSDCRYKPVTTRDLWICSCQAINKSNEESCHKCKNYLFSLENYDLEQLRNEMEERLEAEAKKAEEKAVEQKKLAKKRKKGLIIGLAIAIPIIIAAIVASAIMSANAKKDSIIGDWNAYYAYQGSFEGYISETVNEYSISIKKGKAIKGDSYFSAKIIIDMSGSPISTTELPFEYINEEKGAQYYGLYGNVDDKFKIIVVSNAEEFLSVSEFSHCSYVSDGDLLYISDYGSSDAAITIFRR